MEGPNKKMASHGVCNINNRQNLRKPPVKSVPPRIKNQFIKANCGGVTPNKKVHDCLGQSHSRGDTWHNSLQNGSDMRGEMPIQSELSSIMSFSTMATMNYRNQLNMMMTCDPIHGIKFIVREFKQRLKALYPGDEVFYQMISEIGRMVKRVEYGDILPSITSGDDSRFNRYVEPQKCMECEGKNSMINQLEEDLACEKTQNKILSDRFGDLQSQIEMKKNEILQLEQELTQTKEQVGLLQGALMEKKLYDDTLLNKFDESNKKLQEVTQELFMGKLEHEKTLVQLKIKTQLIEDLQNDLDQIHQINNEIFQESQISLEQKSSSEMSLISN